MRCLLLISVLVLLSACAGDTSYVQVRGERIYVEVEDDPAYQALGLMFRKKLADNRGMLFIYGEDRMLSFWMKNTKIPLDILYFNSERRLVTIIDSAQPCRTRQCPSYPSSRPARYVLEVNAGSANEWGLALGDELKLHLR